MMEGAFVQGVVTRAEDVFGASTVLVEGSPVESSLMDMIQAMPYAGIVAVLSGMFIVYFVLFFDYVTFFVSSSLSFMSTGKSLKHNARRSLKNGLETIMAIMGICLVSMFMVRYVVAFHPEWISNIPLPDVMWRIGGATCLVMVFTIFLEILMYSLVGMVLENGKLMGSILDMKLLHFASSLTVMMPFVLMFILLKGVLADIGLILALVVCAMFVFAYLKEVLGMLREHRISYFLCFLYLCVLEIFPISLSLAPVLRGNVNI